MCVFNMFRVCLHPLGRSFGGKIPLRRVSKNERKLMKQVKQLRKQVRKERKFYTRKMKDLKRQHEFVNLHRDHCLARTFDMRIRLADLKEILADTLQARDDFAEKLEVYTALLRADGYAVAEVDDPELVVPA